jgi:alpha-beta hydrolase superfamily lysophospholipase
MRVPLRAAAAVGAVLALVPGVASLVLVAGAASAAEVPRTEVTFKASDGVIVYADLYAQGDAQSEARHAPIVLLFHQAGANARAEYDAVVPRLLERGYNVLAVDQRSGGDRLGGNNRTADALKKKDIGYCDAYPDLEAALDYAVDQGFSGPRFAWGSSYSAALVIRLGVDRGDDLSGVLAFSPATGPAMGVCDPADAIAQIDIPVLALRPASEMERESSRSQFAAFEARGNATYVAPEGVHGSSMLNPDRADGVEDTWKAVFAFIDSVVRHHADVRE